MRLERRVYIEHPNQLAPVIERGLAADAVTFIHIPTEFGGIGYLDEKYTEGEQANG